MALPNIPAHIHTLPHPHLPLLPLIPPLNSAPRTTTFCFRLPNNKTEESSPYDGRQAQPTTGPKLFVESRRPQ
ncbi:hypothetical protein WAI453_013061 [Rhynchosporium graminicola]